MNKQILTASCFAALAVIAGAFGAHSLKQVLSSEQLTVFETGVRYQFYHSIALFLIVILHDKLPPKTRRLATLFFITGIILFSGSLYLLSCRNILGIDNWNWLGPLTPAGGLCFIAGWLSLGLPAIKK